MRWLFVLFLTAVVPALAEEELGDVFDRDVLVIVANEHACYRFDIYLALHNAQQTRGLMHVRELPETTGMLFVYTDENYRSMWMRNTYIPLDIAFAGQDGVIVNVVRDTEPLSLKSIRSAKPASYVLELNAGVSEQLSIDAGSRLIWEPMFAEQ